VTRKTTLDTTYEYLHNKLVRGELEPGRKLSRRTLAEEIGVSPALVQHALGKLEISGLVECRAQSGTYVRELTADEFANLCDVRELIEPYAASRAAERITKAQLKILEASCRRYHDCETRISRTESALDMWKLHSELIDEERVFHGTIFSAAGNELLTSWIQTLRVLAHVRRDFARGSLTGNDRAAHEHRGIVEALQARDAALAGERMLQHIRNGREKTERRLAEIAAHEALAVTKGV
jgi:DNA-binding GntR family transcriptional regulator